MIAEATERKILDLWAEGLTKHQITHKTGVAKGTVLSIIRRGCVRVRSHNATLDEDLEEDLENERIELGRGRCVECGVMVYLPCRGCDIRHKAGEF